MILLILGIMIGMLNYSFWWSFLSMELLFTKTDKKQLLVSAAAGACLYIGYLLMTLAGKSDGGVLSEFFVSLIQTVIYMMIYIKFGARNPVKIFSAVTLALFFIYNFSSILAGFVFNFSAVSYAQPYLNLAVVVFRAVIMGLFAYGMVRIFRRFHVRTVLNRFFSERIKGILCLGTCACLRMSYYFFWYANPVMKNLRYQELTESYASIIFGIVFTFIVLLFIIFLAVYETNQEKIKAQEAIILQQQTYVQSLEGIQQQMRAFRHDLQNLMSGVYLQASSGDTEEVYEYLKRSVNYFDEHLGNEIKQMGFLSNVTNMELKSLLLVKLMQAQQMELDCKIEVVNPVDEIGMEAEDFLRCLGILVDNAFEEVKQHIKGKIHIIFLNEKEELNVVVKNTIKEKPKFGKIIQKGYSTKGTGRGLGLHIYQQILKKYYNVIPRTVCADGEFRQELKIRRKQR